jgi:site-specific DNA-methyltransferase (adenine-specific)
MEMKEFKGRSTIKIYNGDGEEYIKTCKEKYSLAIIDPPYGININVSIGRRKGDKKSNYHKFSGNDSSIPSAEYFKDIFRTSKHQIIWGGNYMTDFLYPSPCWLLWDKGFSEEVTFAQFELAWSSFKSSAKKFNFNAAANRNRIHPTQKPVQLYKWLLQNYAKEGDTILDTHLGSGSIAIACWDLGYDLTAFEIDKEYFDKACERIDWHTRQKQLF